MSLSTAERATKRFVLRFSYIGTRYRGVQRQSPRSNETVDNSTIQSVLEHALQTSLKPQYPVSLILSSRTDKHVDAHLNTAHVDLTPRPGYEIDPSHVTYLVNRYLRKHEHEIVLRKVIPVAYWYHCRAMAERRKYVYKVGLRKHSTNYASTHAELPLTQLQNCLLVDQKLDLDKIQQACKLFEGYHNHETFRNVSSDKPDPRKHMEEITFVPDHDSGHLCEYSELYTWWKFNVVARSFLYKQVRRIVSCLLCVGKHTITLEQVSGMLNTPHQNSWMNEIRLSHGHALCLADIEYDPELYRQDVPPPPWRPPMPYVGKNASLTSRSAHDEGHPGIPTEITTNIERE